MRMQDINLISFGYFDIDILEKTAEAVSLEFHSPVNIRDGHIDLSEYYDPARRQYNGNALLKQVDAIFVSDPSKTLGLFNVDLFIPILTFIFGQAFLGGRTGIASLYRLSNERYGMIRDDRILLDRFRKEVIHELGHTFGLIHCSNPTCVMRSSTYVEDIDQKSQNICMSCRAELER
ncbi:MAG TPA: archaemetzincin family Zn-dependent metalloprotease [Prolixibacteraceae bacterium]|nr:archaemetzincin family Zn-dependent metalloprotease [Prolixibacteraceae bacterium]